MQLLCSTGAFSRFPNFVDHRAILRYGPQLDVDGFEVMFYAAWYDNSAQIAHDLQQSGLHFPVMHTEKGIGVALGKTSAAEREQGVQRLRDNCHLARLLCTQTLVLHLWGWPELDDHLENNLASLHSCLDITDSYSLTLAIETIPSRHATPLDNVRRAIEQDGRCRIALDTEFLAQSSQLSEVFAIPWVWEKGRTVHAHIKDYDGEPFTSTGSRRYLHPGEGHINFQHFFDGLKQCRYNGSISLESPAIDGNGVVTIEKLQESLRPIRDMLS